MEHLFNYGLFAAKLITVVAIITIPVFIALGLLQSRRRHLAEAPIEIRKLNDKLLETSLALESVLMQPKEFKKRIKQVKKDNKARLESADTRTRIFVCDFTGDIRAHAVSALREEITAILSVAAE